MVGAGGGPDLTDPDLAADLENLAAELRGASADVPPARSPIGLLLRGLALRRRRDDPVDHRPREPDR